MRPILFLFLSVFALAQTKFDGVELLDGSSLTGELGTISIVGSLTAATGDETSITLGVTVNKATSGDATAFSIDVTDTASPGALTLFEVGIGGTPVFSIDETGDLTLPAGAQVNIGSGNIEEASGTWYLRPDGTTMATVDTAGVKFFRSSGPLLLDINSSSAIFDWNPDNASFDFRLRGDNDNFVFVMDASADSVGFGTNSLSARIDIAIDDTENLVGLELNQNDVTNNPVAMNIINTGTGDSLVINDGSGDVFIVGANGDVTLAGDNGSSINVKHVSTELTGLSGATATASNLIPAGSIVLGVSCRVTTEITGATSWDAGDGADVDAWGAGIALTATTTTDGTDFTLTSIPIYPAANDVVLTANGSSFTAGAVRIVVTYLDFTAPTS